MAKNALAVIDQPGADNEAPGLLRIVGGLLDCAERSTPRNRRVLLDAASVLLEAAKDEAVEEQSGATTRPKPTRDLKAFNREAIARAKAAAPPEVLPKAKPQTPAPTVTGGGTTDTLLELHGVSISLKPDDGQVSYRGKTTEVTDKQAQLAALLLKGSPHPIDREFLSEKLGFRGEFRDTSLGTLIGDTRRAVETIGLTLKTIRGVGVSLQTPEQGEP